MYNTGSGSKQRCKCCKSLMSSYILIYIYSNIKTHRAHILIIFIYIISMIMNTGTFRKLQGKWKCHVKFSWIFEGFLDCSSLIMCHNNLSCFMFLYWSFSIFLHNNHCFMNTYSICLAMSQTWFYLFITLQYQSFP